MEIRDLQEIANRASYWTSHRPEEIGKILIDTEEKELEDFLLSIPESHRDWVKEKYITLFREWLIAKGRCMSSFITGPSNFPVRKAEKFRKWEEAKYKEFVEWKKRTKYRLNKKDKLTLDEEYIKTENKIEVLERLQEIMKACNKILRSKSSNEVIQDELENLGLTSNEIDVLKTESGFDTFQLTNNNASIKHHKAKLLKIEERLHARETSVDPVENTINGVKIQENVELDRILLFFEGKPTDEIRNELKRNGFKWSPKNGAWQTFLKSGRSKIHSLSFLK